MIDYFPIIENIETGKEKEVSKALNKIEDINYIPLYGFPLLAYAVINNHLNIVKLFITFKAHLNIKDLEKGQTNLHYSCKNGNLKITKILLENGADCTIQDDFGNEPLDTAVFQSMLTDDSEKETEFFKIIKLLISYGSNINHKNKSGISPLAFALEEEYQPLIDVLEKSKKKSLNPKK